MIETDERSSQALHAQLKTKVAWCSAEH
jgi:hypothetical protein